MDILVRVKTSSKMGPVQHTGYGTSTTYYNCMINLRYMTRCTPKGKKTMVCFTTGSCLLIPVKYENFIALLERLYGEKFIEMENDEEKSED